MLPEAVVPETEKKILTVSELTRGIRFLLETKFANVWVEGEISNFKFHTSGHMYFCLKDDSCQIQAVMFRRENQMLDFEPEEGLQVVCFGRVSVYPVRGQYQLYVDRMEPKGLGALQLRFQQLKDRLKSEGLFDEARKKPLPFLPKTVGIVTSVDGAALHDILNILDRRFPEMPVLVSPVPVQGAAAAPFIAEAIRDMNEFKIADVLIVARGGGSLEDLWAFNEEIVARAIAGSEIPVISAVGHETDFTIADFVSDLRAPTPSAAAELAVPLREDLCARLAELKKNALQAFWVRLNESKQELRRLKDNRVLKDPLAMFEVKIQRFDELKKNMTSIFGAWVKLEAKHVAGLMGRLEALGPLATLKRGFSVSLKLPQEKIITSHEAVKPGDRVKTKLKKGFFISQVQEVHP